MTDSRTRRLLATEFANDDCLVFAVAMMFGFDPNSCKRFVSEGDRQDKIGILEDAILSGVDIRAIANKTDAYRQKVHDASIKNVNI